MCWQEEVELTPSDQQTWTRAFSTAKANWGAHPNVLVNNAGIARSTPLIDITPEELDLVLGINLRAPLQGTLPRLT